MKTKKPNKNVILFAGYLIFVIIGAFSMFVLRPIGGSIFRLIRGQYTVEEAKQTIEAALTDDLTYHDQMVSLNGLKENLLGTKVIYKDDITVVKAESGSLIEVVEKLDEDEILWVAQTIQDLKNVSEENGAEFLYCAAPRKELFENSPSNVNNYARYNHDRLLSFLAEAEVPYIDFSKVLIEMGVSASEMFYYTDHHWKSEVGFMAAKAICEELNARYSFNYSNQYTDINNYDVQNYSEWFLGSKGKKVGIDFTWNGADDFKLILPQFPTDMIEEQPFKAQVREGSFEDSVLYMSRMEKNLYRSNAYTTYSGGDFRLQIMRNKLNQNGKKILMIRDSFACVVCPFLALQTSELHICDARDGDFLIKSKLNMETYIKEIKPDYVLVLYTGVGDTSDSRYDFFPENGQKVLGL